MEVEKSPFNTENDPSIANNIPSTAKKHKEVSSIQKGSHISKRYDSFDASQLDSLVHEIKRHVLRLKLARLEQAHEDELEIFSFDASLPLTLIPRVIKPFKDEKVMLIEVVRHQHYSEDGRKYFITPRGTTGSLRLSTKVCKT